MDYEFGEVGHFVGMSFWPAGKDVNRKTRKGREEAGVGEQAPQEVRRQRRRQWLLPPLARSWRYDRSNSLPETVSKISAVVPDVATVGTQVAAVTSQIAFIAADIAAFVTGRPIISMSKVAP